MIPPPPPHRTPKAQQLWSERSQLWARSSGLGLTVYGLGFRSLGFRSLGFRSLGFRVRVQGLGVSMGFGVAGILPQIFWVAGFLVCCELVS